VSDEGSSHDHIMKIFEERYHRRSNGAAALAEVLSRAGAASPVTTESLLASARRHAARGLRARDQGEHDDASLQLGIMLEHLAKAYLAGLHPTLLLERNFDFFSLVRLAGQGQRIKPGHLLKTVGLSEALVRIGTLQALGNEETGRKWAKEFNLVLQARNGVAHIGDDGGLADQVAQTAVRGAAEILGLMSRSLSELFADLTGAAETLLNEHATAVQQLVALRLAQARARFAERYSPADAERLEALDTVTSASSDASDTQRSAQCPACHRLGVLSGTWDIDGVNDRDDDGEPFAEPAVLVLVLAVDAFQCPVCVLRLRGLEELREAALPLQLVLRPATDEDILSILNEPDAVEGGLL
jgi:hypothetical protein